MASITDEDSSDSGGVMNGTLWIFLAKNATEVREIIERDPYWVDNVVRPSQLILMIVALLTDSNL